MKNSFLFRFLPERFLKARLLRGADPVRANPRPHGNTQDPRERLRFIPMQMGSQILPFIIDTGSPNRRRDPYE